MAVTLNERSRYDASYAFGCLRSKQPTRGRSEGCKGPMKSAYLIDQRQH